MPHQNGKNITILRGETLPIRVNVVDSAGAPATNLAVAKFALKKNNISTVSAATINGSVVSILLTQAQTLALAGTYEYEFRIRDSDGEVDSVILGVLEVKTGPIAVEI